MTKSNNKKNKHVVAFSTKQGWVFLLHVFWGKPDAGRSCGGWVSTACLEGKILLSNEKGRTNDGGSSMGESQRHEARHGRAPAVWVRSQEILEWAKEAALTREISGCLRPAPGTPDGRGLWGVSLRKGRFCPHWGAGHMRISFCQNPLKCTLKMGAFYWGKLYLNNDDFKNPQTG